MRTRGKAKVQVEQPLPEWVGKLFESLSREITMLTNEIHNLKELAMTTIKEGDYISARVDRDLTIEGFVILEKGKLVLQDSDFHMTISLSKLTEIKKLANAQN